MSIFLINQEEELEEIKAMPALRKNVRNKARCDSITRNSYVLTQSTHDLECSVDPKGPPDACSEY